VGPIRIYVVLIIISLLGFSCATTDYVLLKQNYRQKMDSWLNNDVNALIRSWGPPASQYAMPNGNMIYTWNISMSRQNPTVILPSTTTITGYGNTIYQNNSTQMAIGGDVSTYYCISNFEAGQNGKIINWFAKGNACWSN
jgi:hypothetical protein